MELNTALQTVEKRLKELSNVSVFPRVFKEALFYTLLNGGKRLRALLFLSTVNMFSFDVKPFVDIACAIEMIHAYSLIHDDLPAMDNDEMRRGKPSNHIVYGEDIAILAGDGLNSYAFDLISHTRLDASRKIEVIKILSRYTGIRGMVIGQACDVLTSSGRLNGNEKLLVNFIHKHKTARFIQGSILSGCAATGANKEAREKLSRFGLYIGIAFQIIDDCLDIVGDEKKLGKKKVDKQNNTLTYPRVYGLNRSYAMARKLYENAVAELKNLEKTYNLLELAGMIVERDK